MVRIHLAVHEKGMQMGDLLHWMCHEIAVGNFPRLAVKKLRKARELGLPASRAREATMQRRTGAVTVWLLRTRNEASLG